MIEVEEDGRGKGGGSRSMNEVECVLAIANGLCQTFRDLATVVLNPRMRAATRYLFSAISLACFTRSGLKPVNVIVNATCTRRKKRSHVMHSCT